MYSVASGVFRKILSAASAFSAVKGLKPLFRSMRNGSNSLTGSGSPTSRRSFTATWNGATCTVAFPDGQSLYSLQKEPKVIIMNKADSNHNLAE